MRSYKPSAPFNVSMRILVPTATDPYKTGKKIYSAPQNSEQFFGSFRTFGGTENTVDGIYTLQDTAVIDTWYRPDITADCQIYVDETGQIYDIISDPENIDMRHQYMQFKVRKVGGKA